MWCEWSKTRDECNDVWLSDINHLWEMVKSNYSGKEKQKDIKKRSWFKGKIYINEKQSVQMGHSVKTLSR